MIDKREIGMAIGQAINLCYPCLDEDKIFKLAKKIMEIHKNGWEKLKPDVFRNDMNKTASNLKAAIKEAQTASKSTLKFNDLSGVKKNGK